MEQKQFKKSLFKVMQHNDYSINMLTVSECEKKNKWTPIDLIMREYYNNGCGSAKGFLGITKKECEDCVNYIIDNQEQLKAQNMYSENGFNNFGFPLWKNYKLERF